jgi:hypothetical protein
MTPQEIRDLTLLLNANDIASYRKAVVLLSKARQHFPFLNPGPIHANIVLTAIMNSVDKQFYIYDKNILGDIENCDEGFYMALHSLVGNGKQFRFIVDSVPNESQFPANDYRMRLLNTLKKLNANFKGRVLVSLPADGFEAALDKEFGHTNNFAFSDTGAYRIEQETAGKEGSLRKAKCDFLDCTVTGRLKTIFDTYFPQGQLILS